MGFAIVYHEKTFPRQQNQQIFHEKMDRGYERERFESISIKRSVAKKFKKYCRTLSRSQSMTLLIMLDFFRDNGISPVESLGPNLMASEVRILKRINAVIAIMRDMEKTQTKPTAAMILSLFEESAPNEKPLILEKKLTEEKPLKYRERQDEN
ncbi:BfmA/BtgA family mobilization protein [Aequorivita antarctica]|nr:BfmA/BtgA family mobilization protein [Aequorivita antarctica]SRX76398.1 hypothetical protein AEQU3_03398 [Aequorivita antarctica]